MNSTHGKSRSSTYQIWAVMKYRCLNPNFKGYARYGGRGITVCERWMVFDNFYEDMGECPKGMSIDRINNDGNYCPENCRWATPKQQARNTSRNKPITYKGKTLCISEWAAELGISRKTLLHRLNYGWSVEKAFNEPVQKRKQK